MTPRIQFTIDFTPRIVRFLTVAVLVATVAVELGSETLTMSTTYPSPAGIYRTIITTGPTSLARDNTSTVSVGGIGVPSALHVYGPLTVDGMSTFNGGINITQLTQPLTITSATSSKLLLTGGSSQNGATFDAVGGANNFYLYTGNPFGNPGFGIYNNTTGKNALTISNGGNVMITNPGSALIFPDGTAQTTAASGGSVATNINTNPGYALGTAYTNSKSYTVYESATITTAAGTGLWCFAGAGSGGTTSEAAAVAVGGDSGATLFWAVPSGQKFQIACSSAGFNNVSWGNHQGTLDWWAEVD